MMAMGFSGFRKILIASDFSSHSKIAFARAVELASAFQSEVYVAHCLPDLALIPSASEFGLPYNDYAITQEEFRRDATISMKNFLEGNVPQGQAVHTKVLVGDPHIELSQLAQQWGADLVVAGRSGHSGWEQFILGSTTRGLVHRSPTSVLAVSDHWVEKTENVLAGTDFSDASKKAVLEGAAIAEKQNATLHLLHVIDSADAPEQSVAAMTNGESIRQSIKEKALSRLDALVHSLEIDTTKLQVHLSWGTPWRDMCQTAEKIKAELIVIGNLGRRGIKGLVLGNTADRILGHSKSSVLAVKEHNSLS